ncbi:hypothetical protein [Cupriavidus sp. D384]|uniref:hypothetical protein n=1 Tax=Cupriavidus sp. D384 TaxID=1538095 RepID=UPI000A5A01D7|nr:hypothetical protein [Cupriavidus sp. D384]
MTAYLTVAEVQTLMVQARAWVDELARLEGWPPVLRDDILYRLRRGPAAGLPDQAEYFRQRLADARALRGIKTEVQRMGRAPPTPATTEVRQRAPPKRRGLAKHLYREPPHSEHHHEPQP